MKNKKVLIMTLLLLSVVAVTVGVTFAFFSYAKEGTTDNTITTQSIEFLYTEVDKVGAGIAIEEAYPVSDDVGKAQTGAGKVFNFKVTSKITDKIDIPYTVTARKKQVDNALSDEAVRIYLTEVNGTTEKQLLLDNYNALNDYKNRPTGTTEKVIYEGLVSAGSLNYEKNFRLRMWIDSDVKFSPIENEDGSITYPYNDKEFTVNVNVYANAKVVTESEVDMANTTKIESIIVNDPNVEAEAASEEEEYDYIANVNNEVENVSLDIETTNPEATVEVTRLDNTTAYRNNIQRLSQTITFDLKEGDNLFNIKILSANKQVENEYILNVYRALSGSNATYVIDSGTTYTEFVNYGSSVLEPTTFTPTKDGYEFVGWKEDTIANEEVLTDKVMGAEPMTLYAVFKKIITVTYYNNSTTASTTDGTSYYNNGNIVNPSFTLTQAAKSGWTARGWSTTNAGNATASYSSGVAFTRDSSVTLYGMYYQTITLSYNGNGATSGSVSSQSDTRYWAPAGYINPSFKLKSNGFNKTGYSFNGWNLGAVGATVTLTTNTTATAQWKNNAYTWVSNYVGSGAGLTITYTNEETSGTTNTFKLSQSSTDDSGRSTFSYRTNTVSTKGCKTMTITIANCANWSSGYVDSCPLRVYSSSGTLLYAFNQTYNSQFNPEFGNKTITVNVSNVSSVYIQGDMFSWPQCAAPWIQVSSVSFSN